MTSTLSQITGYRTGTWTIDPDHSTVAFSVKHMMVSKVRGTFTTFSGTLITGDDPAGSSVTAEIDLASIETNNAQRDDHIRSADFFDVANHPTMTFTSTELRADDGDWILAGDLTLKAVTKPVELALEVEGFGPDAFGGYRAGFSATGSINRNDFGVDIKMPMDGGGVVVGDKITINLDIEAVLSIDEAEAAQG